jgi:hypothetical protein
MRALHLRKLLLYPRFHKAVAADLEEDAAEVGGARGGVRMNLDDAAMGGPAGAEGVQGAQPG